MMLRIYEYKHQEHFLRVWGIRMEGYLSWEFFLHGGVLFRGELYDRLVIRSDLRFS